MKYDIYYLVTDFDASLRSLLKRWQGCRPAMLCLLVGWSRPQQNAVSARLLLAVHLTPIQVVGYSPHFEESQRPSG
jgi:hypothetical protein